MGTGKKIMFLHHGGMWKNKYPQIFNCPLLGLFTWIAVGFKCECGILPDLGFVWVTSGQMLILSKLELFLDKCIKCLQMCKKQDF